jgi:hypothetical protein
MKTLLISIILTVFTNYLIAQEDTYETTTARVDGVLYKAIYKASDGALSIVKSNGKTVLQLKHDDFEEAFASFKFVDFNGDGYKDLFIEYMSNVPGRCVLLM